MLGGVYDTSEKRQKGISLMERELISFFLLFLAYLLYRTKKRKSAQGGSQISARHCARAGLKFNCSVAC